MRDREYILANKQNIELSLAIKGIREHYQTDRQHCMKDLGVRPYDYISCFFLEYG